ncbi:hypothetical protein LX36DRAFT_192792 [Colletotrichum falcatum]|nr:hypothetical protein LX36DRAFT_192792 [Colletotrichum falcatum]
MRGSLPVLYLLPPSVLFGIPFRTQTHIPTSADTLMLTLTLTQHATPYHTRPNHTTPHTPLPFCLYLSLGPFAQLG